MPLVDDYGAFHRAAIRSGDIDPVYPVLREMGTRLDWTQERRLLAVFAHVAYYDLGSALTALSVSWQPSQWPDTLPCSTERRAHRMPAKLRAHLDDLQARIDLYGSLSSWIWECSRSVLPTENWRQVTDHALMKVRGNGRWASYKTAEMLEEVARLPLAAPDMGHRYSSGPRQGLELLYEAARAVHGRNDAWSIFKLDTLSANHAREYGAKVEQCETTLCDFHSMVNGRYYVGNDIDEMQAQLLRAGYSPLVGEAFRSRRKAFDGRWLGELHGWQGPDRARRRAYRDTGRVLVRA